MDASSVASTPPLWHDDAVGGVHPIIQSSTPPDVTSDAQAVQSRRCPCMADRDRSRLSSAEPQIFASFVSCRDNALNQSSSVHSITSSAHEDCRRNGEAERVSGFEIDDKLEFRRLLDRNLSRRDAFKKLVDVGRCPTELITQARPVARPPASTFSRRANTVVNRIFVANSAIRWR
jgi:hypothetical protein